MYVSHLCKRTGVRQIINLANVQNIRLDNSKLIYFLISKNIVYNYNSSKEALDTFNTIKQTIKNNKDTFISDEKDLE